MPPLVLVQLQAHYPTQDFLARYVSKLHFKGKEQSKFERLVRRWFRKTKVDDPAEVEVLVAYLFFVEADEMLFANKEAEQRFRQYGDIRDICMLYELAEETGVFQRQDSVAFLEALLKEGYRARDVKKLLDRIS